MVNGLFADEPVTILVDQTLTLRGLPALFYVYRFTDESSGRTGIHAHFFVYQGRKMVSMVFQALPEARYELLARTFDLIANSLEVATGPPSFLEGSSVSGAPAIARPTAPTDATSTTKVP